MFVFLCKKIQTPSNAKVKCVNWSFDSGTVAAGLEDGQLKLMKLDSSEQKSFLAVKNLSLNTTLAGHTGALTICSWNEKYSKLITADSTGLIIVWVLFRGGWHEEMVNNSNKNVPITGMRWSPDGLVVGMLFGDGSVILGAINGQRLWEKELRASCSHLEWSPDGKLILIGVLDTEVHVLDANGDLMNKITLQNVAFDSITMKNSSKSTYSSKMSTGDLTKIVAIEWSLNSTSNKVSSLAIAFESGRIQLMRNEFDDTPLVITTGLTVSGISWSFHGTHLAVAGIMWKQGMKEGTKEEKCVMVRFYDSEKGSLVQSLRIPGREISSVSWDRDSLRVVMGVDSFVYFASIRPCYKWTYFGDTCVYSRPTPIDYETNGESQSNVTLVFWSLKKNARMAKSIGDLLDVHGFGNYCVYATRIKPTASKDLKKRRMSSPDANNLSSLIICNSLGTPVDSVDVEILINKVIMTSDLVIAQGKDSFIVWKFNVPAVTDDGDVMSLAKLDIESLKYDSELEIDEIRPGTSLNERRRSSLYGTALSTKTISVSNEDPIIAVTSAGKFLTVALKSGTFRIYMLPKINQVQTFKISAEPIKLSLNSDFSKLAVIDTTSIVSIYDLDSQSKSSESADRAPIFEKKDVWDMKWASDDPESFALLEKSKLMIYKEFEVEESSYATGYLASFSGLQIRMVNLDALVHDEYSLTDTVQFEDFFTVTDTKQVKDFRSFVEKNGVALSLKQLEQKANSHVRLWRILSEFALKQLNFEVAEHCFVRLKEYKSIHFVKRISKLTANELKRAEVLCYFGDFDGAEKVYLDIDRRDLAIRLRKMMGHSLRVLELVKCDPASSIITDEEMKQLHLEAGDYYMDQFKFASANKCYQQADNLEKILTSYLKIEDFDSMSKLITSANLERMLPEFKSSLAQTFESVGMCDEAVKVLLSMGSVDEAVVTCVKLNEWKLALNLAQEHHDVDDIDSLLNKYAKHLLDKKRHFDIIELYRKASRIHDATDAIVKLIQDVAKEHSSDYFLMKKHYTLIGILESEEKKLSLHERREQLQSSRSSAPRPMVRKKSLSSLLGSGEEDLRAGHAAMASYRILDNPWRGAEAFHLVLLTQKLIYENQIDYAMKAALRLADYEEFLSLEEIYSLLALTATLNSYFKVASRAFIKLETAPEIPEERRTQYKNLAMEIFTQHPPKEAKNAAKSECSYCETLIADVSSICPSCSTKFPFCCATGQPIMDPSKSWTCRRCGHQAIKAALSKFETCPLCHYPV